MKGSHWTVEDNLVKDQWSRFAAYAFKMRILKKTPPIFRKPNFKWGYTPTERKGGIASEFNTPRGVTETRHIIGLASYHRKFIVNFSDIVKGLTHPTKKNTTFNWSPLSQGSFHTIKVALTDSPILILPDPSESYILFRDASRHSWMGLLTQEWITSVQDKELKSYLPITYISGAFCRFPEKLGNNNEWSI